MDEIKTLGGVQELVAQQLASQAATGNKLNSLKGQSVESEKELEKATAGFEALLLHEMIKSMWETVGDSSLLGENTNEGQIYRDMLNQAVADSIAEGRGIGVKDFLRKELLREASASKDK